mmetsp:Transcript_1295/g.3091  ORF Transcript_1295/g.3091 Transcript_1295/m.3091 type:complete len:235 (+) Transcript_1295:156-860(+)
MSLAGHCTTLGGGFFAKTTSRWKREQFSSTNCWAELPFWHAHSRMPSRRFASCVWLPLHVLELREGSLNPARGSWRPEGEGEETWPELLRRPTKGRQAPSPGPSRSQLGRMGRAPPLLCSACCGWAAAAPGLQGPSASGPPLIPFTGAARSVSRWERIAFRLGETTAESTEPPQPPLSLTPAMLPGRTGARSSAQFPDLPSSLGAEPPALCRSGTAAESEAQVVSALIPPQAAE